MLSGTSYLVSVKEVIQSEKMKVKSLLKLYPKSKGVIQIKEFLGEFSDHCKAKCDTNFVDSFPYNTYANDVNLFALSFDTLHFMLCNTYMSQCSYYSIKTKSVLIMLT